MTLASIFTLCLSFQRYLRPGSPRLSVALAAGIICPMSYLYPSSSFLCSITQCLHFDSVAGLTYFFSHISFIHMDLNHSPLEAGLPKVGTDVPFAEFNRNSNASVQVLAGSI